MSKIYLKKKNRLKVKEEKEEEVEDVEKVKEEKNIVP